MECWTIWMKRDPSSAAWPGFEFQNRCRKCAGKKRVEDSCRAWSCSTLPERQRLAAAALCPCSRDREHVPVTGWITCRQQSCQVFLLSHSSERNLLKLIRTYPTLLAPSLTGASLSIQFSPPSLIPIPLKHTLMRAHVRYFDLLYSS